MKLAAEMETEECNSSISNPDFYKNEEIKNSVKDRFNEIAFQSMKINESGSGICSDESYNLMSDDYTGINGYNAEANLGLGCGIPTQFAKIKKGDTVIDIGSGAGNDCFLARVETGDTGKVIGIDFSEAMTSIASSISDKHGFNNIEFLLGDIENLSLSNEIADVIVSNCVLFLVPNKEKAFKEIFRVLKPGGHISISDIVFIGEFPENVRKAAEMQSLCVSGAIQKDDYIAIIEKNGFKNIKIQKEKAIVIPNEILSNFLSPDEAAHFKESSAGIFSITVYAEKM